jgi:hypothetical protein
VGLALTALLGQDVSKALFLVQDFSSGCHLEPLGSGLSCFHLGHDSTLFLCRREQDTPEATYSLSHAGYWLLWFFFRSGRFGWRENHAHHPPFHHCRSVNDVSYTIIGELGKYPVENHFAQIGMSQFTASEADAYLYFIAFGEEIPNEFALGVQVMLLDLRLHPNLFHLGDHLIALLIP